MQTTVAEKMAKSLSELSYGSVPQEVIEKSKCCMINGLAIGMAGHNIEFGRMARELIKAEEAGVPSEKGATIFCDGSKVTPMGAAFANAVLLHSRF
jgi:2-methylcitrate dehydratase PrpD